VGFYYRDEGNSHRLVMTDYTKVINYDGTLLLGSAVSVGLVRVMPQSIMLITGV